MALLIENPGVLATVQDRGRDGQRSRGVPVGGAFDGPSHDLANALLANPPDAATLELTLNGGRYRAEVPLALALAGAAMDARIERADGPSRALALPCSFALGPGDRLILGGSRVGARAYLAVSGGWRTPVVLGSRSSETPLRPGDRLTAETGDIPGRRVEGWPHTVFEDEEATIRIIDGPDAAALRDPTAWEHEHAVFRVDARSDRMGLRLDGPRLEVDAPADRVSAPVAPGALQVAGGRPIVLGVACGTLGGYPHVAHVISADLPRLAQLRPGCRVRLRRIDLDEARRLDREERRRRAERLLIVSAMAADRLGRG